MDSSAKPSRFGKNLFALGKNLFALDNKSIADFGVKKKLDISTYSDIGNSYHNILRSC